VNPSMQNTAVSGTPETSAADASAPVHSSHPNRSFTSRALGLLGRLTQYTTELGAATGLRWYCAKLLARARAGSRLISIKPRDLDHAVNVRMYPSSDDFVFDQIFVEHEYTALCDSVKEPAFILDLGANVGYASALFASRYPSAQIVAVEPDPGNYRQCVVNLEPYGPRVKSLMGAVWARRSRLALARGVGCDGREWATQVVESSNAESADVEAWDMPALLDLANQQTVDILKIDIEGSEAEVFAANTAEWLPRVRNICIELHSDRCREIFFEALRGYRYELRRNGEFTLCFNLEPRA
jgi:FkbM family methyltransferase